jgi:hypothetical protein
MTTSADKQQVLKGLKNIEAQVREGAKIKGFEITDFAPDATFWTDIPDKIRVKVTAKGKIVEAWFTQDQAADSYERVDRHDVRYGIAQVLSKLG